MSKKHQTNPKDFAFSKSAFYHPDGTFDLPENGLTKREYFAGMAMQGILARLPKRDDGKSDLGVVEAERIAEESCAMADLLINALNKE